MITNAKALRDRYVPRDMHHREGKIEEVSSALRPITQGFQGEHIGIFGPSGAGKTTIAKYVCSMLEQETFGVHWGYVNCATDGTTNSVLYNLCRDAGIGHNLRPRGTAKTEYVERLREFDKQFVAIVDEVAVLDDPDTLTTLYEIPDVTVLMITLDENEWLSTLDSQVYSRFRAATMVTLDAYGVDELRDIVAQRAEYGLEPGTLTDDALDRIAELGDGDARYAIALLRKAAINVDRAGGGQITTETVNEIRTEAREDVLERYRSQLNEHQKALFDIIYDAGEISASDLREAYEQTVSSPKSASTRNRYLTNLETKYHLIQSEGSGRAKTYISRTS